MLLHAASAVSQCHYNGALERVEVFANKVINSEFLCYFDANFNVGTLGSGKQPATTCP